MDERDKCAEARQPRLHSVFFFAVRCTLLPKDQHLSPQACNPTRTKQRCGGLQVRRPKHRKTYGLCLVFSGVTRALRATSVPAIPAGNDSKQPDFHGCP